MSKYKNELGTLNPDRLLQIHKFYDAQKEKGIYELSEHISDFAEQECEDYKTSLAVASRLINQLQSSLKEKEKISDEFKNWALNKIDEKEKRLEELVIIETDYKCADLLNKYYEKQIEELKAENIRLSELLVSLSNGEAMNVVKESEGVYSVIFKTPSK